MGVIGESLPKVMWPFFNYSLLEGQVLFAHSLGVEKVYINTHHQADKIFISDEIKNKVDVTFVHEEKILGSGGGIHNIINTTDLDRNEPLLVLNADLFYLIDEKAIGEARELLESHQEGACCLFPVECKEGESYNRLVIEDGLLKEITPKDKPGDSSITYSGVCLCYPSRLEKSEGESAFFTTVANYKEVSVPVTKAGEWDYWDFGTYQQYYQQMKNIVELLKKNEESKILTFIKNQNIIHQPEFQNALMEKEISLMDGNFIIKEGEINYKEITQRV